MIGLDWVVLGFIALMGVFTFGTYSTPAEWELEVKAPVEETQDAVLSKQE